MGLIETNSGKQLAVRVDSSFLCGCGCGKRIKGNKRFDSPACRGKFFKQTKKTMKIPRITTCRWCGRKISNGERYCSEMCEKIDHKRNKHSMTKNLKKSEKQC